MIPIDGKEVTRLTWGDFTDMLKSMDNNNCEKSAEAILNDTNEI